MTAQHIVKSFDEELSRLTEGILQMGRLAEEQLASAVEAVAKRRTVLAEEVVRRDTEMDTLQGQIDDLVINLLALRQPLGVDLRLIVSALTIAADFERIGDYAANTAKRAIALTEIGFNVPLETLVRMTEVVQGLVHDIVIAFQTRDDALAMEVWRRDSSVDAIYTSLFRELLTYMMEDPRHITPCTHLLFVAKSLERIGDHATNIAELVCFLTQGRRPSGSRPKNDQSSFAVPGHGG